MGLAEAANRARLFLRLVAELTVDRNDIVGRAFATDAEEARADSVRVELGDRLLREAAVVEVAGAVEEVR